MGNGLWAEGRIIARLLAQPLLWLVLALTLGGAVAAYQAPHSYTVDVGSPADQDTLSNEQRSEQPGGSIDGGEEPRVIHEAGPQPVPGKQASSIVRWHAW